MANRHQRTIYLEDIPLAEAQQRFLSQVTLPRQVETIPTSQASGRVTAEPLFAKISSPAYPSSAMDGIAVIAAKTVSAHETHPLQLQEGKDYVVVDTGDPLPEGYDAVIMIEDVHFLDDQTAEILAPARPWQHVRPIGEDIVAHELIVPDYHVLRPVDLGALLAGGFVEVPVLRQPAFGIIPTGTELVDPKATVERGEIIEYNSAVFSAYLRQWGAFPTRLPIVPDDYDQLKQVLLDAVARFDCVVINAGSSAGREDFTEDLLRECGQLLVHGVATRPGKPVMVGIVAGKPVIGLPGYPVSAYLALEWFAQPFLAAYYGQPRPTRPKVTATAGRRIVSPMGTQDFVRVTLGKVGEKLIANPLSREAGVTMSMVRADGLLVIPPERQGYEQGESVEIELYHPLQEVEHTVVVTGSHDMTIDLLASAIHNVDPHLHLSSANVGSMGGILALRKGETHLAGMHLFDPATGQYNTPYLQRYLPETPVVLVNLVYRTQGFLVPKGNPKGIHSVRDLLRPDVTYINRQRGAGTRILLDYLLMQEGIDETQIRGYDREETTHLGVAAAVAGSSADCGLGVYAAAQAMDLDFLPVTEERYDLCFARSFYDSPMGKTVRDVIGQPAFQQRVEAMGGYSCRDTGKIFWQQ
ncbi:MAG: molybdopterin biosynthesis protein [Firmicutes bacterium]|nr:molybdopterin biosynthesis protein [Bacillota bacterium]